MKKKILTLLLTLCLATSLCACQKAGDNNEVQEETNVTVEDEATEPKSEETSEEESQEVTEENLEEEAPKTNETQTLKDWVADQHVPEPTLAIWNDINCEGRLLEYEEEYQLQEGDYLVLCAQVMISSFYGHDDRKIVIEEDGLTYIKYKLEIVEPCKAFLYCELEGIEGEFSTRCTLLPIEN